MITISKVILSGAAPARVRQLAAGLAADPDLAVSVITYPDGQCELEVLHTGPPRDDGPGVDPARLADLAPALTLPLAGRPASPTRPA
jgi:hypothetical protein